MPPRPAARASAETSSSSDLGVGMRLRTAENVEREGEKAVPGENGGRFIERLVRRRPAAAQVVIVHGGKIVVGQRVAMHTFQRRPGHEGILPGHIEQRGRFHHQEGPQPLAAAEAHIAHGIEQARRPGLFAVRRWRRKQAIEQGFSVVGDLTEAILKDRLDVHVFLHSVDAGHARSNCP